MQGGKRLNNINKVSRVGGPLVSIITVVLNGKEFIEQTIKSVLEQSYNNIEYIIIDGGSTDGTIEIIQKYNDRIDLWISEKDGGIYFAMNKGIQYANGKMIGILNADDYYSIDAVKIMVESDRINEADIYHGDMFSVNSSGQEVRMIPDISLMKEKPSIFHPTCFVKKSVYEHVGVFNTDYLISSDYDFLLRCLERKYFFHYIPEVITTFRNGGSSASCYTNIEGYRIMKAHNTGYQNQVIWRAIKCYLKVFVKKIINLGKA